MDTVQELEKLANTCIQKLDDVAPGGVVPTKFKGHYMLYFQKLFDSLKEKVPLRLIRSVSMQDPQLLVTQVAHWLQFGSESPQVRLDRLRFAMTSHGRVLVQGQQGGEGGVHCPRRLLAHHHLPVPPPRR